MLDELCLRAVDAVVTKFTHWFAPWKIWLKNSVIGFRPALVLRSVKRTLAMLFNTIATADDEDSFLRRLTQEPEEPTQSIDMKAALLRLLTGVDAFFEGKAFGYLLLMTMLACCLLAGRGTRALAVMAAFLCMHWMAQAFCEDYAPICGGVRQRYLAALLLRAGAYLLLMLDFFAAYAAGGLQINIVLQGTMIATLAIHLIVYLGFVAFNRRQQLFLRALCGVLGVLPALACASGVALGVSMSAQPIPLAAGGLLRAIGAAMAFLSWQVEMLDSLGGRLPFARLWQGMTMTIGFFMMLGGAWLCAL